MVTIYDVAYKSGVSISTVSRVLNNNLTVQEDLRQRVQRAVKELGFQPNPIARGLVMKRTKLIEVCFSWSGYRIDLENPWYFGILNGVNQVAQDSQYGLVISTLSGIFDPQEICRRILSNTVDGVLMVSPYLTKKGILDMVDSRVPIVLAGCRVDENAMDYVDSDNLRGAEQAIRHLARLGHRKIACITGEGEFSLNSMDRLEGSLRAAQDLGLSIPDPYIVRGDFGRTSGTKAAEALLALSDPPTAIFAFNDLMALGAWDAVQKAGLTIGRDISLVGFDDIPAASQAPYSLTTIRQDFQAISLEASKLLIEKTCNPDGHRPRKLLLPTQLVERRSCGVPR